MTTAGLVLAIILGLAIAADTAARFEPRTLSRPGKLVSSSLTARQRGSSVSN